MSTASRTPAELTRTDGALRRDYLQEVARLLWPAPATAETGRAGGTAPVGTVSDYIVVPGLDRPRLLVPLGSRRAAATAVRRYSEPSSRLARCRLEALALVVSTGLGRAVMRDRLRVVSDGSGTLDTIETYLAQAVGTPVRLSLHIGPARANRKPVLQLLTDDGEVLGFAKVGVNDLTRRLVGAEARSLVDLGSAGLTGSQVPRVLHHARWQGLEILVQSPLPIWEKRVPLGPDALSSAMLEVARTGGVRAERLDTSPFWAELRRALDELSGTEPVRQLRSAFASVADVAGGTVLPMGAWHGDWTPWNCASVSGRLLVWDWERFQHGVPLGFDALHFDLQSSVVGRHADARLAVAGCMARAGALLAPFGLDPAVTRTVAVTYLIALATRYLQDGQAEAGARLGVLGRWLLPELVAQVAEL